MPSNYRFSWMSGKWKVNHICKTVILNNKNYVLYSYSNTSICMLNEYKTLLDYTYVDMGL